MASSTTPVHVGQRDGLAAAAGSIAVLAVALLLTSVRDALGLANVALLLTLVVIGAAAIGGRTAGVTTAVVGALGFNAIHVRPYGTLRIDRREDILTCILMIVVGIAVGQLAHRARDLGHRASSGEIGLRHLCELRDLVAQHAEPNIVVERASGLLVAQLGLRSCTFAWSDPSTVDGDDVPPALGHSGGLPGPLRHGHGGFQLPSGGVSLPVYSTDGVAVGRFLLEPTPGRGASLADRELAVLVVDVISPALRSVPAPSDHPTTRTGTDP